MSFLRIMICCFVVGLFSCHPSTYYPQYQQRFDFLKDYQHSITKAEAEHLLNNQLLNSRDKEKILADHFEITAKELRGYLSVADKAQGKYLYRLRFGNKETPGSVEEKSHVILSPPNWRTKNLPGSWRSFTSFRMTDNGRQTLSGIRIALDPGHVGGDFAEREGRFVRMKIGKVQVSFNEGDLAYLTAMKLKEMLEADGAEVLITRPGFGKTTLPNTFDEVMSNPELLKQYAQAYVEQYVSDRSAWPQQLEKIMSQDPQVRPKQIWYINDLYLALDRNKRLALIRDFKPDLVLVLHFNGASEGRNEKTNDNLGTKDNFNMVFVPGGFPITSIEKPLGQSNLLRLLVQPELLSESKLFSEHVIENLVRFTHVPAARLEDAEYLRTDTSWFNKPGVYGRYLALLNRSQFPTCYAEALIQDNFDEALKLNEKNIIIAGHSAPSRILDVVKAYHAAIVETYRATAGAAVNPGDSIPKQ